MKLEGAQVVVVGMGKSGVAALRLLREKGASVRAVDEKQSGEIEGIPIEPQIAASFRDVDLVVLSPGVPMDLEVLNGLPVIGELELASYYLQGENIGITG